MGDYYKPSAIIRNGTKMAFTGTGTPPKPQGELAFVVVLDNGIHCIAGNVTDEREMTDALSAFHGGAFHSFTLYSVPKSKLPDCRGEAEPSATVQALIRAR